MNTKAQIEQDDTDDINEDAVDTTMENDNDFEIEVVDDVPEEQKPRRAEGETADVPDDDDLESYSESVQKRIKKLKFEYHEAERQRQEAARLREEAINYAKQVQSENERLRQNLQKNEGSLVEQAKGRVEAEIEKAKTAYRAAYEAGDSDNLIEAQTKLTQLQNDLYRLQNYRPAEQEAPKPQPQTQQNQQPQVQLTPQQKAWLDKNDWYGKNRPMTAFALGVHEELVQSGVVPDSERYYKEIDAAVRRRFADEFSDAVDEEVAPRQKKAANVVAPAARSAKSPRKVKLTSTQAAIAKRLGLTNEQYAAQLMKDARNG